MGFKRFQPLLPDTETGYVSYFIDSVVRWYVYMLLAK